MLWHRFTKWISHACCIVLKCILKYGSKEKWILEIHYNMLTKTIDTTNTWEIYSSIYKFFYVDETIGQDIWTQKSYHIFQNQTLVTYNHLFIKLSFRHQIFHEVSKDTKHFLSRSNLNYAYANFFSYLHPFYLIEVA